MTLSKPEDIDDVEQSESNESDESGGREPTVDVEWENGEMPVSEAVEGLSRIVMDASEYQRENSQHLEERVGELEQMVEERLGAIEYAVAELQTGFELLLEEHGEKAQFEEDMRGSTSVKKSGEQR